MTSEQHRCLSFGAFDLDLEGCELRRSGVRVRVVQQALRALALLASRPGQVVTRGELRQALWPDGTHVDFEAGINFCIAQVRTALGDSARAPRFVETLPRIGYRFLADVRTSSASRALAVPAPATASAAKRRRASRLAAACLLGLAASGGTERPAPPSVPAAAYPAAQQEYLRGLRLLRSPDPAGWSEAEHWLALAVAREPRDALAQAALAEALLWLNEAGLRPAHATMPRARSAALAALREDPRRAEAWLSLAAVRLYYDWDWNAREDIARALALEPARARNHAALAAYLSARGEHAQAIDEAQRATAIDPLCPAIRGELGWYYYCARRFDEAASQWRLAVGVVGDSGPRDRLADALRHVGRPQDAWREARATMLHAGIPPGRVDALERRGADRALRAFLAGSVSYLAGRGAPPERLAALHAALGEREQALAELERAAAERSRGLLRALAVDPDFDSLRALPRYRRLVQQAGLS